MDQLTEELTRVAREANRVDRERTEKFEVLLKSPGWQEYVALLNSKIQMTADELMRPASGMDGLVAQEYVKGTLSGLIMARDIPSVTIAQMKQLRSELAKDHDDA